MALRGILFHEQFAHAIGLLHSTACCLSCAAPGRTGGKGRGIGVVKRGRKGQGHSTGRAIYAAVTALHVYMYNGPHSTHLRAFCEHELTLIHSEAGCCRTVSRPEDDDLWRMDGMRDMTLKCHWYTQCCLASTALNSYLTPALCS